MAPPEAPSARELARRLIAREGAGSGAANAAAAAQAACERLYRGLALWLGPNGARALFMRALAQARAAHAAIREVGLRERSETKLDGVTESIKAHGAGPVAAGLVAVLEGVLELLARLLGADIAERLVEQSTPDDARDDDIAV